MEGKETKLVGKEDNGLGKKELDAMKDELNAHLLDYLNETGRKPNKDGNIKCVNPNHNDEKPSMHLWREKSLLHCFPCDTTDPDRAYYDLVKLVRQDRGLSYYGALAWLAEHYKGIKVEDANIYKGSNIQKADLDKELSKLGSDEAIAYLQGSRGFKHAKEIAQLFRIKSNDRAIFIPHLNFREGDYITTDYQARAFVANEKGERFKRKGQTTLYDPSQALAMLKEGGINLVIIVEGEIDALSIYDLKPDYPELKNLQVIALSGTPNTRLLEQALEAMPQKERANYGFIVGLDNDDPGKQASIKVEAFLTRLGYAYTTSPFVSKPYKDANEELAGNRGALASDLKGIIEKFSQLAKDEPGKKREEYIAENSATSVLDSLISDINAPDDKQPLQTQIEAIDRLFDYDIGKGLMTIGATTGLGKTTFALQLADQIAQTSDRDILYFPLEMQKKELIGRSISRLTYLNELCLKAKDLARTANEVIQGRRYRGFTYKKHEFKPYSSDISGIISGSIDQYKTFASKIFFLKPEKAGSYDGQEIADLVEHHIAVTKRKPIVVVDYLQIMKPQPGLDPRQATDANLATLKALSDRQGLLVILISSVSRANYNMPIDTASFKESGTIEYTCDYLVGLDLSIFDTQEMKNLSPKDDLKEIRQKVQEAVKADPDNRYKYREITFTILKNRSGVTGGKAKFHYYPAFNTFVPLRCTGGETYTEDTQDLLEIHQKTKDTLDLLPDDLPF
jgi:replicative DNA helicase